MAITLRQETDARATTKGNSLTFQELDNNFIELLDRSDISNVIVGGTDITVSSPDSTGAVTVSYSGTAGIANVVEDTTPQLGGNLDVNGFNITSASGSITLQAASNQNITLDPNGGQINISGLMNFSDNQALSPTLKDYKETVYSLGTTDTPSLSVSNGNVQTLTITSGLTLPAFTDAATGQTITLIVSGSGTASGTGAYKFAGGNKTLTTSSVISIFYDGTTYWTSIATDFQS